MSLVTKKRFLNIQQESSRGERVWSTLGSGGWAVDNLPATAGDSGDPGSVPPCPGNTPRAPVKPSAARAEPALRAPGQGWNGRSASVRRRAPQLQGERARAHQDPARPNTQTKSRYIALFGGCKMLSVDSLEVSENSYFWFAHVLHFTRFNGTLGSSSENPSSSSNCYLLIDGFCFSRKSWTISNGLLSYFQWEKSRVIYPRLSDVRW